MISEIVHHTVIETSSFTPLDAITNEGQRPYSSIVLLIACSQRKVKHGMRIELTLADSTASRTLKIWKTGTVNLMGGCVLMISNYLSQGDYLVASSDTIITVLLHPKRDETFFRDVVASLNYAKVLSLEEVARRTPLMVKHPLIFENIARTFRWALTTDYALLITRYRPLRYTHSLSQLI